MIRPPGKLYVGLTEPPMYGGVEKPLFTLNLGVAAVSVLAFKSFWWLPMTGIIHFVLKHITKGDPFLRGVYLAYQRQADRYEPFPESSPRRGLRPILCGRGVTG